MGLSVSTIGFIASSALALIPSVSMPTLGSLMSLATCAAAALVVPPRLSSHSPDTGLESKRELASRLQRQAAIAELQAERLMLEAQARRLEREMRQVSTTVPEDAVHTDGAASASSEVKEANSRASSLSWRSKKQESSSAEMFVGGEGAHVPVIGPPLDLGLSLSDIEDAQYRTVWSDLGLPEEAYPSVPLDDTMMQALVDNVFGLDSFYVHEVQLTPVGAIFRGSLRRSDPAVASALVQQRLLAHEDLAPKVRLFLLRDPMASLEAQSEEEGDDDEELLQPLEPVFLAIPADACQEYSDPPQSGLVERLRASPLLLPCACAMLTIVASACFSFSCYGDAASPAQLLPLTLGLIGVQLLHEMGHALAARAHGLKTTLPLLFPSPTIGCFGGHTPLTSYPANRTALFDLALSGPLLGMAASLAAAGAGLVTTAAASPQALELMPALPLELLHSSLLFSLLAELALGPPSASAALHLHPLAIVGFAGMVSNSIALLPCGRLDGGRAAMATFGRRGAGAIGGLVLLALGTASFIGDDSQLLASATLLLALFLRQSELPSLDEVTPVDEDRSRALLFLSCFAVFALYPAPHVAIDGFAQQVSRIGFGTIGL